MHIAILTFDGFNELDSMIALGILNRIKKPNWRVTLACPTPTVTSMNGVTIEAQSTLAQACQAEAVIIGSGTQTRQIAQTTAANGLQENAKAGVAGGRVAKRAKDDLEQQTGQKVVTGANFLPPVVEMKKLSLKSAKKRKTL